MDHGESMTAEACKRVSGQVIEATNVDKMVVFKISIDAKLMTELFINCDNAEPSSSRWCGSKESAKTSEDGENTETECQGSVTSSCSSSQPEIDITQ